MAQIIIPTPLRKFTSNQAKFETEGKTVSEAILALTTSYGDLKQHLVDDEGKLRSFVRVYLGDEDINVLQKEATPIEKDSIISIIPAIAGGIA